LRALIRRKAGGRRSFQRRLPRRLNFWTVRVAAPYGVYDIGDNAGWVSVGINHDTASFAVNAIRGWWKSMGRARYPNAGSLLITADGGGSNGSRVRLWKVEPRKLADELGLAITVCHLPPGTSKWNKIEHEMFSFITGNWRGKPLVSHQVIVQLIAATTTKTGLTVRCELDPTMYPAGVKVSDDETRYRQHCPTRIPRRMELYDQPKCHAFAAIVPGRRLSHLSGCVCMCQPWPSSTLGLVTSFERSVTRRLDLCCFYWHCRHSFQQDCQ